MHQLHLFSLKWESCRKLIDVDNTIELLVIIYTWLVALIFPHYLVRIWLIQKIHDHPVLQVTGEIGQASDEGPQLCPVSKVGIDIVRNGLSSLRQMVYTNTVSLQSSSPPFFNY